MAEREVIIDKMRMNYEGLFDVKELYKLIDGWLREKGYDKREKRMSEKVTESGKFIEWEIEPWKKITDYAKNVIKLRVIMTDITEVEVERDKAKVKLNKGKVDLVFDGYLETDYENRWEGKPLFYFLRTLFNKYIFKSYSDKYYENIISDVNHLQSQIKSFLNLYRYSDTSWSKPASSFPAL